MTKNKNRQWILNVRPAGRLTGEEFGWNERSIPQYSDGQVVIRNLWLSVDPAQRIWRVSTQRRNSSAKNRSGSYALPNGNLIASPAREDPAPGASTCAVSYGGCLGRIYAQTFVKDGTNPTLDCVALHAG